MASTFGLSWARHMLPADRTTATKIANRTFICFLLTGFFLGMLMSRESWVNPWKTGDGTDALCGGGPLYRREAMVGGGGVAKLAFQACPHDCRSRQVVRKLIEILFPERRRQEGITKKNFANRLGQIACESPFRDVAGSPRGKRG